PPRLFLPVTAVTVTPAEISVPQLVMNCLAPLTTQWPSRSSARVLVAPASEPASGSVSPNAHSLRPASRSGSHFCFCAALPKSRHSSRTARCSALNSKSTPGLSIPYGDERRSLPGGNRDRGGLESAGRPQRQPKLPHAPLHAWAPNRALARLAARVHELPSAV